MIQNIPLDKLRGRSDNANCMSDVLLQKLISHIKRTDHYPCLIVRMLDSEDDQYEILDGHHRVCALREIGYTDARCEVWDVDDDEALVLMTTLNRLEGRDDPVKRGELIHRLVSTWGIDRVSNMLPEESDRLQKLMDLRGDVPKLCEPPAVDSMIRAVTFFLTGEQEDRLANALKPYQGSRTDRLLEALQLNADEISNVSGDAICDVT